MGMLVVLQQDRRARTAVETQDETSHRELWVDKLSKPTPCAHLTSPVPTDSGGSGTPVRRTGSPGQWHPRPTDGLNGGSGTPVRRTGSPRAAAPRSDRWAHRRQRHPGPTDGLVRGRRSGAAGGGRALPCRRGSEAPGPPTAPRGQP